MSEEEIQRAMRDAAMNSTLDETRRSALLAVNDSNALIFNVEQALAKVSKKLDKMERKQVKDDCAALSRLVSRSKPATMSESDISAINQAKANLERSSANVMSMAANEPDDAGRKRWWRT